MTNFDFIFFAKPIKNKIKYKIQNMRFLNGWSEVAESKIVTF